MPAQAIETHHSIACAELRGVDGTLVLAKAIGGSAVQIWQIDSQHCEDSTSLGLPLVPSLPQFIPAGHAPGFIHSRGGPRGDACHAQVVEARGVRAA